MCLCLVTKNKAMYTTSLHTAMNLHMLCMSKDTRIEIHFPSDYMTEFPKILKSTSCDRLVWVDYGVSVDLESLKTLVFDEQRTAKAVVVSCVREGVDWDKFRKKTIAGSSEPVNQRGLSFDIVADPKTSEYVSGDPPRVFCVDCKAVLRKLREANVSFKSFEQLKKLGLRITVLQTCAPVCHYVYESVGNILESSGVRTGP